MKYYIMKHDIEEVDPATAVDSGTLDPLDLLDGKLLPKPGELQIKLSPRSNDDRGDLIPGVVTLFHDDLKEELEKLNIDNIQYFPADIVRPDDLLEEGYSVINIIGLIDAVDVANSKIKPRAHGGIGTLYSFSIDEAKAKGLHIFRILHAPSLIIVDEWLKAKLLAYEIEGVIMYPTEDYNGWS